MTADSTIDDDLPIFRQKWAYDGKFGNLLNVLFIYIFVMYNMNSSFTGQQAWQVNFPPCGGKRQSPVNIVTKQLKKVKGLKLIMKNYDTPIKQGFVENNGHTLQLGIKSNDNRPYMMGSAVDNQKWIFQQMHFHWGDTNNQGTEHSIDGQKYALEVRIIHFMYFSFAVFAYVYHLLLCRCT